MHHNLTSKLLRPVASSHYRRRRRRISGQLCVAASSWLLYLSAVVLLQNALGAHLTLGLSYSTSVLLGSVEFGFLHTVLWWPAWEM